MTHRIIFFLAVAGWLATTSLDCANDMSPAGEPSRAEVAAQEAANDQAQQLWQARRAEAIKRAEAEARVLVRARTSLQGKKDLGIPRDVAICFEARNLMQRDLEADMRSGGEFGKALEAWHMQAQGVETFCTYALTVGAPN